VGEIGRVRRRVEELRGKTRRRLKEIAKGREDGGGGRW